MLLSFLQTATSYTMATISTRSEQIVKDQEKFVAEPSRDARMGPRIEPNPKAPVLMADR